MYSAKRGDSCGASMRLREGASGGEFCPGNYGGDHSAGAAGQGRNPDAACDLPGCL